LLERSIDYTSQAAEEQQQAALQLDSFKYSICRKDSPDERLAPY
jgi:hypothetical protein